MAFQEIKLAICLRFEQLIFGNNLQLNCFDCFKEMALINEFTVKDSVYFFGRIYNMDSSAIEEKYQQLKKMLELPSDER